MSTSSTRTAVCYGRFSTVEQSKGYSLERQKTKAIEFAVSRGWHVESVLFDEGKSAFHARNRAVGSALGQFEQEASQGLHRGKVLIVENVDRLSRQGLKEAAKLIWALNAEGVSVATYHDGHIYEAEGKGDLYDIILLAKDADLANKESEKKSKRAADTWSDRHKKLSKGEVPTLPNRPHWIEVKDGQHTLIPNRAAVINEIYDLYLSGVGIHRITTILNERQEPRWSTKNTNGWFYSYVYRLLTKRAVIGDYVDQQGKILAAGVFPPAVTREKWNRVQAALAMRKSNAKKRGGGSKNLLTQLVFCAECGGGANFRHGVDNGQKYTRKNGEVVVYRRKDHRRLRCDRNRRKHDCQNSTILDYDVVEATLLNQLLPQLVDRPPSPKQTLLKGKLNELRTEEAQINLRIEKLLDAIEEEDAPATLVERLKLRQNEKASVEERIEALTREIEQDSAAPDVRSDLEAIEKLKGELTSSDEIISSSARLRVNLTLRRLIERVLINSNGTFTIQPDEQSEWLFDSDGTLIEGYWS